MDMHSSSHKYHCEGLELDKMIADKTVNSQDDTQGTDFLDSVLSSEWRQLSEPAKILENSTTVDDTGSWTLDDQLLEPGTYEPGCFLRQLSEPAKLPSTPKSPPGLPRGVRVKNTFLDFGGDFELADTCLQTAKPAKIHMCHPGQDQCLTGKHRDMLNFSTAEGGACTFGSDESNCTTSVTASAPDSPRSRPATPESGSPHSDPRQCPLVSSSTPQMVGQQEHAATGPSAYTVTIHGLPRECTSHILMQEFRDAGFRKDIDFDFAFIPRDVSSGFCLGCAFLNFLTHSAMKSFIAAFQGRSLRSIASDKVLSVSISTYFDLVYITSQRASMSAALPATQPRFCTSCGCRFHHGDFNFCPGCGAAVRR
mmetsp:Transcript_111032/g.324772  ORF Transcript_111032/g.324772 Transcript_111032/m.324772 type:complete len:367 (-) Transcript_111032:128-1228(-)